MTHFKPSILIVDDELSIREAFAMVLQDDYNISMAASGEAALKKIVDEKVDLVFLDIRMPGMDGIETLKNIKSIDNSIEVVMVTAVNDVQKARQATALGANNYIVKPFDVEHIINTAKRLAQQKSLKQDIQNARSAIKKEGIENQFFGSGKRAKAIQKTADTLSQKDIPVLFFAENGCETDLIAGYIHKKSSRSSMPFKSFDVKKYPQESLCAMLFGEGSGISVQQLKKNTGIFEEAEGGTILLNHVENAHPEIQEIFYDIIKTGKVKRLGSMADMPVNIRIALSSDKDLKSLCDDGLFSKKLFELFKDSTIIIPPLRERSEDILYIVNSMLERLNASYNKSIEISGNDLVGAILEYPWPGNYRELADVIERIFLCKKSETLTFDDLPCYMILNTSQISANEKEKISLSGIESIFEKDFIREILNQTNSDKKQAAQMLEIKESVLSSILED